MPCLCTTKTLRLFIRSVAQVDLSTPIIRRSQHFQKTATQSFTSKRKFGGYHIRTVLTPSSVSNLSNCPVHVIKSPLTTQQASSISKRWLRGSAGDRSPREMSLDENAESAFVELSPESVDAIAADSKVAFGTPRGQSASENRFVRDVSTADPVYTKIFQRMHFSAPRAPLQGTTRSSREPKPSTTSNAGPFHVTEPAKLSTEEEWNPPPREHWQIDKAALKEKFPDGWNPRKRLSPDALAGIRALHAQMPEQYTTSALAASFQVSPESIRRILKSKWTPDADEEVDRKRRWFNRGKQIYTKHAELGLKPPRMWRDIGIGRGKPAWKIKAPLPALVTTARRQDKKYGLAGESDSDSLADTIL